MTQRIATIAMISLAVVTLAILVPSASVSVYSSSDNAYLTYENKDYGISLEYPSNWTEYEINLEPFQVVYFSPTEIVKDLGPFERGSPPVDLSISSFPPGPDSIGQNMSEMGSLFFSALDNIDTSDYRIVDHNLSGIYDGKPGFQVTYYDYAGNKSYKRLDILFSYNKNASTNKIDDTTELIQITYSAEPGYFDRYLVDAKYMIDTFHISR